ncbi:MAG: hypothetical protein LBT02_00290 [Rickettsiales bacterium]|jgi:CarD family transcriptional regulator|nr:hypothetical protein [Rickettsiales bacterium]
MKNIKFEVGEHCIYKTHGLAKVQDIQTIDFAEVKSKCLVLYIERDKMTIFVPMQEVENGNLRKVSSEEQIDSVFIALTDGVKKIKGIWSRRIKEYEDKINSGDVMQIAEVIKTLTRDIDESQRAFSERMIYEEALFRLAGEVSIVKGISMDEAKLRIIEIAKQKVYFKNTEDLA